MPDRRDEQEDDFGAPPSDEDFGAPPSDEDFGAAPEPVAELEQPRSSAVQAAARGAQQGLFLDFADELGGAGSAAIQGLGNLLPRSVQEKLDFTPAPAGEAYESGVEDFRKEEAVLRKEHPVAFGVGKAGGSLAPVLATAGSSAVQQGVGKVLGKVLSQEAAKKIAPKAALGLAGAAGGAVGAAGASTADNLADVAKEAGVGAALGGATGAFPLAAGLPAAGYAWATGDEADRAELLASLLAGGAASKLGTRRQARETGRSEAQAGRAKAVGEVKKEVAPKLENIEAQIRTDKQKLADEEALVRRSVIQESDKEAAALAKQDARRAQAEAAAAEKAAAEKAGLQADEEAAAQLESHAKATRESKQFGSEEKAAQTSYNDYKKSLLAAEAGGAKERAALEKARSRLIAEATKLQERRAELDVQEQGKLGREYQSAYDALRNFLSVPDEALDPEAIVRRNELREKMGDVANRRFQDLTPEEKAKIYREKLEADLATEEGALNREWMSLDEQAEKLPGTTEKGTPDLERFREPLTAEAQRLGLDLGPEGDLHVTPPKAGKRPEVPEPVLPATLKVRKQKLMAEAVKAVREGNTKKAAEAAKQLEEIEGLAKTRTGKEDLTPAQQRAVKEKMAPKKTVFRGKHEQLGRERSELEQSASEENIIKRGQEEIAAQRTAKPEPLSIPTGKIDAIRQVVGRLLGPRKVELKSPEARAAFHDAAYKRLNSQFMMAPANEAQDYISAGRVLRAFAAGNIAPAHLVKFGEGNPVLLDALNAASAGEEEKDR